jgi:hypothetical protein
MGGAGQRGGSAEGRRLLQGGCSSGSYRKLLRRQQSGHWQPRWDCRRMRTRSWLGCGDAGDLPKRNLCVLLLQRK